MAKVKNFDWNPENIEKLGQLWDGGFSATSIALQMGGDLTRNAIMGKAHRLGLKARKKPTSQRVVSILDAKRRKTPFVKPLLAAIPAPKLVPRLDPPNAPLVPFLKLNYRTCRSVEGYEMVGAHQMALYCSNPKEAEESFCPYHQKIYYRQDVR